MRSVGASLHVDVDQLTMDQLVPLPPRHSDTELRWTYEPDTGEMWCFVTKDLPSATLYDDALEILANDLRSALDSLGKSALL